MARAIAIAPGNNQPAAPLQVIPLRAIAVSKYSAFVALQFSAHARAAFCAQYGTPSASHRTGAC